MAGIDRLLDRDPTAHERLAFVATMAPPVDLPALSDFFANFPPFKSRGIASHPTLRVNIANLRGQDWPDLKEGAKTLKAQIEAAREQYLQAVESQTRAQLSPVIRSLFEPAVIGWHHRNRSKLKDTFTPGGNCRPGVRKLHVNPDGRFQPCERTGRAMEIGRLGEGIQPQEVQDVRDRFHRAVQDRCGNCWALRMCGICFAVQAEHSDLESGDFPVPESVCEAVRFEKAAELRTVAQVLKMPKACRQFLEDTSVG